MGFLNYNKVIRALLLLSIVMLANLAKGQESRTSELYKTLKNRDSLIFEVGFNQCNLSAYDTLVSEDLEFYHDKAGPSYGKAAFIATVQKNICNGNFKPKRELVDSSLKVFPMYNNNSLYGAIQEGVHLLYKRIEWLEAYGNSSLYTSLADRKRMLEAKACFKLRSSMSVEPPVP